MKKPQTVVKHGRADSRINSLNAVFVIFTYHSKIGMFYRNVIYMLKITGINLCYNSIIIFYRIINWYSKICNYFKRGLFAERIGIARYLVYLYSFVQF